MQGTEIARNGKYKDWEMPHFCRVWKIQGIICIIAGIAKCKE